MGDSYDDVEDKWAQLEYEMERGVRKKLFRKPLVTRPRRGRNPVQCTVAPAAAPVGAPDEGVLKELTIDKCDDCKFMYRWMGTDEYCNYNKPDVKIPDSSTIPQWCPLPDYDGTK